MLFVTLCSTPRWTCTGRLDYVNTGHHAALADETPGAEAFRVPPTAGIAVGIEEDMRPTREDAVPATGRPAVPVHGRHHQKPSIRPARSSATTGWPACCARSPPDVAPDALIDAVIADVRARSSRAPIHRRVTSLCLRYRG